MKLKPGKLPPDLLKELLDTLPPADASVIVAAAVGEDAAAIDAGGEDLIVAKTDPITLAGADAGRYLLAVNGNDLATMGAEPRWLLVTALLPEGMEEEQVRSLFADLTAACREYEVALVGGHTEVTVGLDRLILVGCLLGTVSRDRVVRTAGAKIGDAILLTQGVAIRRHCHPRTRAFRPAARTRYHARRRRPSGTLDRGPRPVRASGKSGFDEWGPGSLDARSNRGRNRHRPSRVS